MSKLNLTKAKKRFLKEFEKADKKENLPTILDTSSLLSMIMWKLDEIDAGKKVLIESIDRCKDTDLDEHLSIAYGTLAFLQSKTFHYKEARENLLLAIRFASKIHNNQLIALHKSNLAKVHVSEDDYSKAEIEFLESLELLTNTKQSSEQSYLQKDLGIFYFKNKQFKKSLNVLEEAISSLKALELKYDIIQATRFIGRNYFMLKEFKLAESTYLQALSQAKEYDSDNFILEQAWVNLHLTELSLQMEKYLRAEQYLNICLKIFKDYNDNKGLAHAYKCQIQFLIKKDRALEAEGVIANTKDLIKSSDIVFDFGDTYEQMAYYMYEINSKERASKYFQKAQEEYNKVNTLSKLPSYFLRLGKFFLEQENFAEANSYLDEAYEISKSNDDKINCGKCLEIRSMIFHKQNNALKAEKQLVDSLNLFKETESAKDIARIENKLGVLYLKEENHSKSSKHLQRALEIFKVQKNTSEQLVCFVNLLKAYNKLEDEKRIEELHDDIFHLAETSNIPDFDRHFAYIYMFYGDLQFKKSNFKKSEEYYEESKNLYTKLTDKQGKANIFVRLARIAFKENKIEDAAKLLTTSLQQDKPLEVDIDYANFLVKIATNLDEKGINILILARLHRETAILFERVNNIEEAITEFLKSSIYWVKIEFYLEAIEMGEKALEYLDAETNLEKTSMAQFFVGVSSHKAKVPNLEKAKKMLDKAISGYSTLGDLRNISQAHTHLGMVYLKEKNNNLADKNFEIAVRTIENTEYVEELAEAYEIRGDFKYNINEFIIAAQIFANQISVLTHSNIEITYEHLRRVYSKFVASHIAVNNFKEAISVVIRQLETTEFKDKTEHLRLICELGSLLYLEGDIDGSFNTLTEMYELGFDKQELIIEIFAKINKYYGSLGLSYSVLYFKICRASSVFHYLGDAAFNKKKFVEAKLYYSLSANFLDQESKLIPEQILLSLRKMVEIKKKNAKAKTKAEARYQGYTTGKSKFPCLRCDGTGKIYKQIDHNMKEVSCPLCNSKGIYIQK